MYTRTGCLRPPYRDLFDARKQYPEWISVSGFRKMIKTGALQVAWKEYNFYGKKHSGQDIGEGREVYSGGEQVLCHAYVAVWIQGHEFLDLGPRCRIVNRTECPR